MRCFWLLPLVAILLAACGRPAGESPHKVYVMLGFHGNFYHSWRGDTPDEAGFGQDIRIVRELLRTLDEANAEGLDARGYWDVENLFTYEEILPKHAPDIIDGIRRRIHDAGDEALLMPYDNGLLQAMTEDEMRANVRWAISNPWGSGVKDLFGEFTPIFRSQEMTLTTGSLPILADEGVEGLILWWAGVPFNSLSAFVPPIPPEQRYGTTTLRLRDEGPTTLLLPAASVGDILNHTSMEKWLLDLRALQTSGRVARDLVIHINADADGDFWLPVDLPPGLRWLPNSGGLREHIEAVNRYGWAEFITPAEWLAKHPPEGEILVRQDLADGAFDGQYSWAEKFASHGIWTGLEQSRLASWRADALADGALAPLRARLNALLREGRDSAFFHRVRGLSTTHFGMSTPIVNEERQAVAEAVAATARDRAREAERLAAEHVAAAAPEALPDAVYAFEIRDVREPNAPGVARSLVRVPLVFAGEPPLTQLIDREGRLIRHALTEVEPLGDGRFAAELWMLLPLYAGESRRLALTAAGPPPSHRASPHRLLTNDSLALRLDEPSGIASLSAEGVELGGSDFLSSFITYRSDTTNIAHPNSDWSIVALPSGPWLQRARLTSRISFETPEDGEVAAEVSVTLSLPGDAPWLVADVEVAYPYTTKQDVLHNPAQKLRRYLDRRWVEVAPFQLHPSLDGTRADPLRVWKHNYLGVTSWYDLDYAQVNPANAEIDAFNHQVTAGWVAVADGNKGLLVAADADVLASFAFAPMRLRERDGRQALWLNPFGSYHGRQLDYSHTGGTGLGAEITELFSSSLYPNGPSYNGERERFSLLLAPYPGDAPPEALQRDAKNFFAAPAVVYLKAPEAAASPRVPHEVRALIAEARRVRARAEAEGPLPAPRAFLANPTAGAVDVVWDEPDDARIDGYEVAWREAGSEAWQSDSIAPARRHRVTKLTDGLAFELRVRAISAEEAGPWTVPARVNVGPVEMVEMAGEVFQMSPGLMWRYFKSALVHAWATR